MGQPPPSAKCSAVIVASGGSRRMGFDKLTATLAGRAVLCRTIDSLAVCPHIGEIILVCPHSRWETLGSTRPAKGIDFRRVDGGAERQDSVAAGLAVANLEFTLVHDGARPLVNSEDVARCISAAIADGAAALGRRIIDTLRRTDDQGFAAGVIDREHLWAVETPQCAPTTTLRYALAHAATLGHRVTDETTALALAGVRVRLVESHFPNPKITTPADLALAAALLA